MALELLTSTSSGFRLRGRNIMALVVAPELPVTPWFAAFDEQMRSAPAFFAGRPVVADLSGTLEGGPDAPLIVLEGLEARECSTSFERRDAQMVCRFFRFSKRASSI